MAVKTWGANSTITTADLNSYVANPMLRMIYGTSNLLNAPETVYDSTLGFRWFGTGLFTSEFENYRLVLPLTNNMAGGALTYWWYLRFTVAGVANTTANYSYQVMRNNTAAAQANVNGSGLTESLVCEAAGVTGVSRLQQSFEIDIYCPQIATKTSYAGRGGGYQTATGNYQQMLTAGGFNGNTQFDGLCLYARAPLGALPNAGQVGEGPLYLYGYVQT